MNSQNIINIYNQRQKHFERLKNEAHKIIAQQLNVRGIKLHHLGGRVKELDSLIKKSIREKMSDPFAEMTDIVGLRVVYLFQGDLKIVKGIIRKCFRVVKEEDKLADMPIDVFNYGAPHFDVKLPDKFSKEDIGNMTFEIQVHTICQDAWAAVSHIFYKGEGKVPSSFKKDFYALNGLFYVADTHFEMLRPSLLNKVS
jgi:ppGpp synthetase/RelA/SpoT-type nucleotidyltranferase